MLASIQILIHLSIFLLIVVYKQRCNQENYRASAGLLAFLIGGFNLAMIGYLLLIQPKHAALFDYFQVALAGCLLAIMIRFKGNTAMLIDYIRRVTIKH